MTLLVNGSRGTSGVPHVDISCPYPVPAQAVWHALLAQSISPSGSLTLTLAGSNNKKLPPFRRSHPPAGDENANTHTHTHTSAGRILLHSTWTTNLSLDWSELILVNRACWIAVGRVLEETSSPVH